MIEDNIDALMKKVISDALELEWSEKLSSMQNIETSESFKKQMKRMLNNPIKWRREKTTPIWKNVLKRVAVLFLISNVALGTIMLASEPVRGAVQRWIMEIYDDSIVYRYGGEDIEGAIPNYKITKLPKGYKEANKFIYDTYVRITYNDDNGRKLYFSYSYIQQGSLLIIHTENMEVSQVKINSNQGDFYQSLDFKESNGLTWIDETKNIQYVLNGFFSKDELIEMAESVK